MCISHSIWSTKSRLFVIKPKLFHCRSLVLVKCTDHSHFYVQSNRCIPPSTPSQTTRYTAVYAIPIYWPTKYSITRHNYQPNLSARPSNMNWMTDKWALSADTPFCSGGLLWLAIGRLIIIIANRSGLSYRFTNHKKQHLHCLTSTGIAHEINTISCSTD